MWTKSRTTHGLGGFTRYAASTCLNHLKLCTNQPPDVRQRAQAEAGSPKKQRFSPYEPVWTGATLAPGTFPSGSNSSLMLPPSLPSSTHFNSLALSIHSTLPSPSMSVQQSPLLSALPSPSIGTFPLFRIDHPPTQPDQSPASIPQSLFVEPATSQTIQLLNGQPWSPEIQGVFENRIARLTAAAGLPLSWVDNPEWIDFIHQFLPWATSPSRKVLTSRLVPRAAETYRQFSKKSTKGQNATIQADGWTAVNFHHLLAFMITTNKKVQSPHSHFRGFLQNIASDSHGQRTRCI